MKEMQVRLETDTEDIDLDKILKLLKAYNKSDIEFTLDFCELEEVIKYYINRELDIDLDMLDIFIDIYNENDITKFELDLSNIDNESELDYLKTEFKKHFGVNIFNCSIRTILRIMFIDCCTYSIYNEYMTISFSADNLKDNWLFKYFKNN